MTVEIARKTVAGLRFPAWVHAAHVTEDLDSDHESILRVWLEVDPGLDVDAIYTELSALRQSIQETLREAGVTLWVAVVLGTPVAE